MGNGGCPEELATMEAEEEPLSPTARLFTAPRFNCCIITVVGCQIRISADKVKEGLKLSMMKHPRFSSKLVAEDGGEMKWVPTIANVENHVTVPDLDPEMKEPNQFVQDYISNLTTIPMDMSKPLWDMHILNVRTNDAEAIAVLRVHHSIGDGISLMSLFLACCRKVSDPAALPSLPKTRRTYSRGNNLMSWLLMTIWTAWWLCWNTMVDILLFMATVFFLKDTETLLKGVADAERNPKLIVHRIVSLDDIKLVKNALNTTINDVALGITEAGLSCYLNREYANGDKSMKIAKSNNLPEKIRLRTTLIFNIRPNTGIQALADMMSKKSKTKWGNQIGYILFPFTITLRKDPLDYIRVAKATIDKKKLSLQATHTSLLNSWVTKLFGTKASAALGYKVLSNTTLSFSNVVGPAEEISFYGHPLAYLAPTVYGHPQALTVHFQSYANKMIIVVAVDPNVIPDPHLLCNDFEESLKIIKNVVIERGLVKN